jgi:1-deoxy-D-xylulose-5-phosphate synthase
VICFCDQFCVMASSNSDGERTVIRKEQDEWKINFSAEKPATPLLDTVNYPAHMKNLTTQV